MKPAPWPGPRGFLPRSAHGPLVFGATRKRPVGEFRLRRKPRQQAGSARERRGPGLRVGQGPAGSRRGQARVPPAAVYTVTSRALALSFPHHPPHRVGGRSRGLRCVFCANTASLRLPLPIFPACSRPSPAWHSTGRDICDWTCRGFEAPTPSLLSPHSSHTPESRPAPPQVSCLCRRPQLSFVQASSLGVILDLSLLPHFRTTRKPTELRSWLEVPAAFARTNALAS